MLIFFVMDHKYLYHTRILNLQLGADKSAVAERMAVNKAKLDMPKGQHEQPGAGQSLQGQP